jgi:hypothetical protein
MEPTDRSYDGWIGRDAYDSHQERIGEIKDIYYDDVTGRPEWVAVKAGMFKGTRLVPIAGAQAQAADGGDRMTLAYDKDLIGDAPDIDDAGGHLDPDQERDLYAHYGFDWESRTDKDYGYGTAYGTERFDKDYEHRTMGAIGNVGTEQRVSEHTEEVPVEATIEVPISTTVRLRRWQTEKQATRTVTVPVTETEDHVEVAEVEAKGEIGDVRRTK